MTIAERRRQQFFRSKLEEPVYEKPTFDHYPDGKRQYDGPSYKGRVYACSCGQWFVDLNDLASHIEQEAKPCDTH